METRTAAPGSNDIVQYVDYDPSGRVVNASVSYFVSAYTGGPGSAAFSSPDASQAGTQTTYDGLGRTLTVEDPLSETTSTSYQTECGWTSPADDACYQAITVHDALMHKAYSLVDGLGRTVYSERDTGNSSGTWGWYSETHYTYDANGNLTKIFVPYDDPATTTFSYDATGRTTGMTDPDRGTESYAYDANGNVIQTTDARGSSGGGVIYAGYDGLNRQVWRNTSNSPTGAYVTYSYDSTTGGNYGVGRLTGETFSGGGSLGSGSYSYTYDRRGETTSSTMIVGGTSYPVGTTYNDAGQALMLTYPNGETATAAYNAQGWLGSLTRTQGSITTKLLNAIAYTGSSGASGQMTSAQLGVDVVSGIATYSYSASFDTLARPTDVKTSRVSDGATLFEEAPTYDALGNITSETTTLPTGTDVQAFCYDDFSRLTWAGSTGTPPCTGTAITPGTLTAAQYTQSFSYDNQDRLRSSPLGSYSYDDPAICTPPPSWIVELTTTAPVTMPAAT